MPIGKNSIKRVANNGYSNVKTAAPDMENSSVIANPSPEVIEKMIPSSKKIAPKKPAAKKITAKKQTIEATAPIETVENDGFAYIGFGEDLPVYLL